MRKKNRWQTKWDDARDKIQELQAEVRGSPWRVVVAAITGG